MSAENGENPDVRSKIVTVGHPISDTYRYCGKKNPVGRLIQSLAVSMGRQACVCREKLLFQLANILER